MHPRQNRAQNAKIRRKCEVANLDDFSLVHHDSSVVDEGVKRQCQCAKCLSTNIVKVRKIHPASDSLGRVIIIPLQTRAQNRSCTSQGVGRWPEETRLHSDVMIHPMYSSYWEKLTDEDVQWVNFNSSFLASLALSTERQARITVAPCSKRAFAVSNPGTSKRGASQCQQIQSNVKIGALTNTGITACNNIDFASQADRSRDLPNNVLESVQVR